MKAAKETISRDARKNYEPYWNDELKELEEEVSKCRDEVETDPTTENNIALKTSTATYRRAYNQAARNS